MKPSSVIKISEHDHQVQVIDWCNLMANSKYPMLKWIYAVPNGGDRHPAVAVKLKAEGVKAGVPDLCLPYPVTKYHGLYIEMKSKSGTVEKNQKQWLEFLHSAGYMVAVAWDAEEAIAIIEDYIESESRNKRNPQG